MHMDRESFRRPELDTIDAETLKWLLEFATWKRRKAEKPQDVTIGFLLVYMAKHLYDYYFIQRNYSSLVPLLEAYAQRFGQAEGLTRLIEDVREKLGRK